MACSSKREKTSIFIILIVMLTSEVLYIIKINNTKFI
jgi:hypothetical protein